MFWYDMRRSLFSKRMLWIILFALICLYQPTFYLKMVENRWIWESDLLTSLQDAFGLGIFELCAPATAAICASALYLQDISSGVLPFYISRIGSKRYIFSKFLCSGLSGSLSLALPILLFSFLQFTFYSRWQCAPDDWKTIFLDIATYVSYGFVWADVGLALSVWTDSVQVAYAAPFAIAMTMKTFSDALGKWLDPSLQVSPLNGTLLDWKFIFIIQGSVLLACAILFYIGVKKCIK